MSRVEAYVRKNLQIYKGFYGLIQINTELNYKIDD